MNTSGGNDHPEIPDIKCYPYMKLDIALDIIWKGKKHISTGEMIQVQPPNQK